MNIRTRIIVITADFGMGGISKSAIEWLDLVDYNKYEVTLYIRRNDVLELLPMVNQNVNIITVDSGLKKKIYDKSLLGKCVGMLCNILEKVGRKYLAKQIYKRYKYPLQRQFEGKTLRGKVFDVAIAYSTADDIPVFVLEQVEANKKYLFIHQSTAFSKENQKTLEYFDGVVAVSDTLCQKLKKEFSKKQIKFISLPNYVSHNKVVNMSNEIKIPTDVNKIYLATCGRLVDVKGYEILLDVAQKLKSKNISFVWNWIGDGDKREDMERGIVERGLSEEVNVLGEQINPYPYIKSCDIYVQPSKAEASPLAIFEALSLGKVVISTKTIGGKYILTKYNCGKLVDFSSDEISERIFELAKNPKLLQEEQNKVMTIDWEKEEANYRNHWDQLLSGKI